MERKDCVWLNVDSGQDLNPPQMKPLSLRTTSSLHILVSFWHLPIINISQPIYSRVNSQTFLIFRKSPRAWGNISSYSDTRLLLRLSQYMWEAWWMWFVMDETKAKPAHMYRKNNLGLFSWQSEETELPCVTKKGKIKTKCSSLESRKRSRRVYSDSRKHFLLSRGGDIDCLAPHMISC